MSFPTPSNDDLPRVLLVEDSETSAALLSRYLRGRFEIRHARDGEEAWKTLYVDRRIELVVTDIQMPHMTGLELLSKIRASGLPSLNSLPVIVMTTANDNKDRDLAFEFGANDFVTKPVDPVELQARISVHQKLARTIRELETNRKLLQEQATTDALTRLKNRRAFFETGKGHFAFARRHGTDLSVIAIDVDHFKKVNDTYGHQVGDEALVAVAETLRMSTRTEDTPARIGGEEFAILLPDTNRVGAAVLAERIRETIENKSIAVSSGHTLALTVSVGIASYGSDGHESLEHLMNTADKRLYLAKQNGRNRVVVTDEGKSL
jgi:two-component system cell cycle response regulator